jgi:hypothetical protein
VCDHRIWQAFASKKRGKQQAQIHQYQETLRKEGDEKAADMSLKRILPNKKSNSCSGAVFFIIILGFRAHTHGRACPAHAAQMMAQMKPHHHPPSSRVGASRVSQLAQL